MGGAPQAESGRACVLILLLKLPLSNRRSATGLWCTLSHCQRDSLYNFIAWENAGTMNGPDSYPAPPDTSSLPPAHRYIPTAKKSIIHFGPFMVAACMYPFNLQRVDCPIVPPRSDPRIRPCSPDSNYRVIWKCNRQAVAGIRRCRRPAVDV